MTRQEIQATYKTYHTNGYSSIVSPGKFEGAPIWAPYFYDVMMNGMGESLDSGDTVFEVMPEDIAEFPELKGMTKVYLAESDDGFVWAKAYASAV